MKNIQEQYTGNPAGEYERRNPVQMVDLLNLDQNRVNELGRSISACQGAVQVWVHTHFDEELRYNPSALPGQNDYFEKRDGMIEASLLGWMPIIALIEADGNGDPHRTHVDDYARYYSALNRNSDDPSVYFVTTHRDSPVPETTVPYLSDKFGPQVPDVLRWNHFAQILHQLGVKTIILRGSNYMHWHLRYEQLSTKEQEYVRTVIQPPHLTEHTMVKIPGECVGATMRELEERGFDVRLSRIVGIPGANGVRTRFGEDW